MTKENKIRLYVLIIMFTVVSFFIRRVGDTEKYIRITETKYLHILPNGKEVMIDEKDISDEDLFFIRLGYYE